MNHNGSELIADPEPTGNGATRPALYPYQNSKGRVFLSISEACRLRREGMHLEMITADGVKQMELSLCLD